MMTMMGSGSRTFQPFYLKKGENTKVFGEFAENAYNWNTPYYMYEKKQQTQ
jgi:hypothetical protein